MERSLLSRLPLELRTQVYEHVFLSVPSTVGQAFKRFYDDCDWDSGRDEAKTLAALLSLPLTRVCKQMRRETLHLRFTLPDAMLIASVWNDRMTGKHYFATSLESIRRLLASANQTIGGEGLRRVNFCLNDREIEDMDADWSAIWSGLRSVRAQVPPSAEMTASFTVVYARHFIIEEDTSTEKYGYRFKAVSRCGFWTRAQTLRCFREAIERERSLLPTYDKELQRMLARDWCRLDCHGKPEAKLDVLAAKMEKFVDTMGIVT